MQATLSQFLNKYYHILSPGWLLHIWLMLLEVLLIHDFLSQVKSIVQSYRWAPFLPVLQDSSMLTVLVLLSKYRLRNVPVVEPGKSHISNFITQSAIVQGLKQCKGRDWFDFIAARPLQDLGLPFMSKDEVIHLVLRKLLLPFLVLSSDVLL